MKAKTLFRTASTVAVLSVMGQAWTTSAVAQDAQSDDRETSVLFEEILVTATKKSKAEAIQDVPVAVTAYNERQIDALHIREISGLSFKMPNVALDDIGTTRGTANFSIRGLGINSSIPSIDPTVGVFIDGMYMGLTAGVLFDQFDVSSIEVLRGPQGLLFGRNVTGGAVLLNTTRPDFDEARGKAQVSYKSGDDVTVAALYTGPVSDKVAIKMAGYYNNDGGWFTNLATGEDHGKAETLIFRPAIAFRPSDSTEVVLRYEHGDTEGDGPAAQNHGLYGRDTFDFAIDETGNYDTKWDQASAEINVDVGWGDGTITNIAAWRKYNSSTVGDIDSTPNFLFHAPASTRAEQFSNELRYSGRFDDKLDVTFGLFYFTQDLNYFERRQIAGGAVDISGGGLQDQSTKAVFASFDYDVSDKFTIIAGGRYTKEEKSANVAALGLGLCDDTAQNCDDGTFSGVGWFNNEEDWSSFTPKIGFQYRDDENSQLYMFWTKGFRSGGYNLRNTSPANEPGPFDPEKSSVFELGLKRDSEDKKIRTNLAVFLNNIKDLQREVNLPDPITGVSQRILNTADARIWGFEAEVQVQFTPEVTFFGNLGAIDPGYTDVRADLNNDGNVDEADEDLKLPRAASLTYSVGLMYDTPTEWGNLSARVDLNHRGDSYYTDSNVGRLNGANMLNFDVTAEFAEGKYALSVFGSNILNEVTYGGDSILPFFPGATFSPLAKGAVYGAELTFRF